MSSTLGSAMMWRKDVQGPPYPGGEAAVETLRLRRNDTSDIREAIEREEREPRILCWNCKKLTPYLADRCTSCGARFAGSTGGVYAPTRRTPKPSPPATDELTEARRSLLQLFEDLQRVHDVAPPLERREDDDDASVLLFTCPSCGRFVSEDATSCACGARFAPETSACPKCGSPLPGPGASCPACQVEEVVYACPLCGAEVDADAMRCSCGARFEA